MGNQNLNGVRPSIVPAIERVEKKKRIYIHTLTHTKKERDREGDMKEKHQLKQTTTNAYTRSYKIYMIIRRKASRWRKEDTQTQCGLATYKYMCIWHVERKRKSEIKYVKLHIFHLAFPSKNVYIWQMTRWEPKRAKKKVERRGELYFSDKKSEMKLDERKTVGSSDFPRDISNWE